MPRSRSRAGSRSALVGLVFVYVLAVTVTEAAQIVGTLLVLSLAITPAAAARRLSAESGAGGRALGAVRAASRPTAACC